jgi:murein DD-endopeptidase MepM/ murein hydrolase activator NlpD
MAFVYFNQPATAATVRFQDRQYPMLRDGERWWAIIGVGAFQTAGLVPVSVSYVPPSQTGTASVVRSINVVRREFPVEYITLDPQTASLLSPDVVQNELAQRAQIYSGYTAQRLWSGPFRAPVSGPITGIFGEGRSYNNGPVTDYHRGTDWAAPTGTEVVAAAAGRVVFTGELKVRGNSVIIDHGAGVFTAYHHLSAINVSTGQTVAAGQLVGAIGSTGLVTGPHLHWEVVVRGVEVDGRLWLEGVEIAP